MTYVHFTLSLMQQLQFTDSKQKKLFFAIFKMSHFPRDDFKMWIIVLK